MRAVPTDLKTGWVPVRNWVNRKLIPFLRDVRNALNPETNPALQVANLQPYIWRDDQGEDKISVGGGYVYGRTADEYFKQFIPTMDGEDCTGDPEACNLPVSVSDKYLYLEASFKDKEPAKELDIVEFTLHSSEQTSTATKQFILWAEIEELFASPAIKQGSASEGPIALVYPEFQVASLSSTSGPPASSSSSSSSSSKDTIFRFGDSFHAFEVAEGKFPYFFNHFRVQVVDGCALFPIDQEFVKCTNPGTMAAQVTAVGKPVAVGSRIITPHSPNGISQIEIQVETNAPTVVQVALSGVKLGKWLPYHGDPDRILDNAAWEAARWHWGLPERRAAEMRESVNHAD